MRVEERRLSLPEPPRRRSLRDSGPAHPGQGPGWVLVRGRENPPLAAPSLLTRLDPAQRPGVFAEALSLSLAICHLRGFLGRESPPPALRRPVNVLASVWGMLWAPATTASEEASTPQVRPHGKEKPSPLELHGHPQ